jgi:pyrrolidone-carboxylate peptidase
MHISRVLTSSLAALALTSTALAPATAAPPGPTRAADCYDTSADQTVEQARLDRRAPRLILERSGADARVEAFAAALCRAPAGPKARLVVNRHGSALWRWATARAQGRTHVAGTLPGGDDRPLYWARVAMTRLLTQWQPPEKLATGTRARLLDRLETTSRGQDTLRTHRASDGRRVRQVVVTGFDPFTLDQDTRIGNPSGAVALALDGRKIRTKKGWVRIETASFPVRWDDFTDGEVERTLAPQVRRGLDALVTVSQGRPDQFDLEVWNGANRGGFADNENLERTGMVPIPEGYPTVTPQPQFTRTNLPVKRMKKRDTGDYRVRVNREITERDPATGDERTHTDGPTPGWEAVAGSPGDYLSNEIAYRATLLRDGAEADNVGGHVHTPVLGVPRKHRISDRGFVHRRDAMVEQTLALVRAAAVLRK